MGPAHERDRHETEWTRIRRRTVLPCDRDMVEVQFASGDIKKGRAGDFVWNFPRNVPGRIIAFRFAG